MSRYEEFQFKAYSYESATGTLQLNYAFLNGPEFTETIIFPEGRRALSEQDQAALDNAFRLIFLLAGVSYYKADIPHRLACPSFDLDPTLAAFCAKVYRAGLGEFAFCNNVTLDFVFETAVTIRKNQAASLDLPHRLLVPVGGGKDSITSIEALRHAGYDQTLIACGGQNLAQPIADTLRVAGLPSLHIKRFLSPNLMALNAQGALNGHVPITAILSSIVVACAILYGYDTIVLSNEYAASEPNVVSHGAEVNHQYSKSFAFEQDFNAIVQHTISPSLSYFSLLRPLTETAIAMRFSKCEAYHAVFRSCNTAFKQDESARGKKWCCTCPKCRFVFLALASFMGKEKLIAIFGANLLADMTQLAGFKELCGLGPHKPFECVGEVEESALLMMHLSQLPEWQGDGVIADIAPLLKDRYPAHATQYNKLFALRTDHQLSNAYLKVIADA
ncbi:MAG: endonuclease domain-containing protein [Alphaproteobacteria bacterium]|nr:endonuclease domain-containing protein [Alphaproteobacteria bacterium]